MRYKIESFNEYDAHIKDGGGYVRPDGSKNEESDFLECEFELLENGGYIPMTGWMAKELAFKDGFIFLPTTILKPIQ